MKLAKFDGTPFAKSLKSLLGTLLAGHPDSQAILADVTAERLALRITIDQTQNVLTIGATQQDGERRLVATVDMAGDASEWHVIFPDWNAEPPPIDAVLH